MGDTDLLEPPGLVRNQGGKLMSIPAAGPQRLDLFGPPLVIERRWGQ
jgi:hypothetical protein